MPKIKPTSAKLSDSQLVILSAAVKRDSGSLLPFPKRLAVEGAALHKLIAALEKQGLIEKRPVSGSRQQWRRDQHDRPVGLFIAQAGLDMLGLGEAEPAVSETRRGRSNPDGADRPKSRSARPEASSKTKQDAVIQLLRRKSGASIDDIMAETGWQRHSVRGFFSAAIRKKLDLPLVSEIGKDGVRRYHLPAIVSAEA